MKRQVLKAILEENDFYFDEYPKSSWGRKKTNAFIGKGDIRGEYDSPFLSIKIIANAKDLVYDPPFLHGFRGGLSLNLETGEMVR